MQERMYSRLNSRSAYYSSIQNRFLYHGLSKNININVYRTLSLLIVLYECETWSVTLREENG
jgi:hypothetical protein